MKNIVLIGLPGCGKTTIGRQAAKRTGRAFIDLDDKLVQDFGMTIPDIFARFGETGFRDRETAVCRSVAGWQNTVISCGGGVVLRPENIDALRQNGTLVFIDRPAEDIVRGVDVSGRPLLAEGAERVYRLAAERDRLYREYADVILPNTGARADAIDALVAWMTKSPLRLAVIGDPIAHSLSPAIHQPTLDVLCPGSSYEKIHVRRGELASFVETARQQLDGFNLTMPHKADILPLLDEIDPAAAAIGAVNTVAVRDGKLCGTGTDGGGFFTALAEKGVKVTDKHIVILGTGGVAITLAVYGAEHGIRALTVVGRQADKAAAITQKAASVAPSLLTKTYPFSDIAAACREADILINATPLGMEGVAEDWSDLSFLQALPPHAVVCDLIYKPAKTAFLQAAEAAGHPIQNGLDMLLYQAILADEFYLGVTLGRRRMASLVRETLAANERKS